MTPRQQLLTVLRGPCIIRTLNGSAVVEHLVWAEPKADDAWEIVDGEVLWNYREKRP